MANNLDLAPPARTSKSEPVLSSRRGQIIVRIMVKRARKALEDHTKFENTVLFLTKLMVALGDDEDALMVRTSIAAYIRAKPIKALRITDRGEEKTYALRWDEGDKRFVVTVVPTQ